MKAKRKRRVYQKIDLLETSCVGIPAYPFAHLSAETSLLKALSNTQLNPQEVKNNMEENETVQAEAPVVEEVKEEAEVATPEAVEEPKAEEPKVEEAKVEEVAEETEDKSADMKLLVKQLVTDAMNELTVERGLVAKEQESAVKSMSIGELAMKSGLFIPNK